MLAALAVGVSITLACWLPPPRAQGGDTVPGRLGAAVMRCRGNQDLSGVDWLRHRAHTGRRPYYVVPTRDGSGLVSTFGPAPAVLGALALPRLARGEQITDSTLRERARLASSSAVGVAAFFVALAGMARVGRWGCVAGLVAGLSFAGITSLGQALWQQTAALPFVCAALAVAMLGERAGELRMLVPSLAAVAAWIRPAEAPLAMALVAAGFAGPSASALSSRKRVLGYAMALCVSIPFADWFWTTQGHPWPFAAQWQVNTHAGELAPFTVDPRRVFTSFCALVVSPGKGLLFFAPATLMCAFVLETRAERIIVIGCIVELVLVAAFEKWWGGIAFGPRLLALPVFALCGLSIPSARHRKLVSMWACTAIATVLVGLLGSWGYDPRHFDLPNDVDRHPERLFSVRPSPLTELRFGPLESPLRDAPDVTYDVCGEPPLEVRSPR